MPLMQSFFAWIVIGLAVGLAARLAMPRQPDGAIAPLVVGIAGALLAGYVAEAMGWRVEDGWRSHVAAAAGAIFLVGCYRLVIARRVG